MGAAGCTLSPKGQVKCNSSFTSNLNGRSLRKFFILFNMYPPQFGGHWDLVYDSPCKIYRISDWLGNCSKSRLCKRHVAAPWAGPVSQSIPAPIVKYHRLGSLYRTQVGFSQLWRLWSSRSRDWQMGCLGRACFLVQRHCLFAVTWHSGRGKKALCYKGSLL